MKGWRRQPRVNNYKSCTCNSGHTHHSRGEAGYCNTLALMLKAGEIKSYKTQVKYSFDINGKHIANHYVDFEVENNDGSIEIHEFKGMETDVWKLKHKLFLALYPTIPYLVIKK